MNTLRALFLLICVTAFAQAKDQPATPIVVDIPHQAPTTLKINGNVRSFPEAEVWLQDISSTFGRSDPVVIRLESNEDIHGAAMFARLALKSHDNVYIALRKPDKADRTFYLLPVGSNAATFTIQTETTTTIPTLQFGDQFPDSVREQQINSVNTILRGHVQ